MLVQHGRDARPVDAQHALEIVGLNVRRAHQERVAGFLVQRAQVQQLGHGFLAPRRHVRVVRFQG